RRLQPRERVRIAVVAVDVLEPGGEGAERGGIEPAVFGDAALRALEELIARESGLGDADDRDVERTPPGHRLERRKDLLIGEVAGRAEEDQGVRLGSRLLHRSPARLLLLF